MSGMNPVILIQLLMKYHSYEGANKRVFKFTRNERMRIHRETDEEASNRKSVLSAKTVSLVETDILSRLRDVLKNRVGKVWIDPKMKGIALPLQMATGETGFGVLPTGSRIDIPKGKFIRAFTYWEKVNDIDLSVFAITEDGRQREFSWRNMYNNQGAEITFSGDQTSGYKGGSEYFDIHLDLFKEMHPEYRYLIFCNNVYSGIDFSKCECFAGFMSRFNEHEMPWKGEREIPNEMKADAKKIFDPKTVGSSFRINADSTFCYLFAIDLENRQMIWLNLARDTRMRVAGEEKMDYLTNWFKVTEVINLYDLFTMMATEIVDNPEDADICVSDDEIPGILKPGTEWIHSWNFEKVLGYLQAA